MSPLLGKCVKFDPEQDRMPEGDSWQTGIVVAVGPPMNSSIRLNINFTLLIESQGELWTRSACHVRILPTASTAGRKGGLVQKVESKVYPSAEEYYAHHPEKRAEVETTIRDSMEDKVQKAMDTAENPTEEDLLGY